MNVYLDNCIIVDLENRAIELSDLKLGSTAFKPIYSIAHLFEAKQKSNITDDFIVERCGLLHRLTNSTCANYNQLSESLEIIPLSPLIQCDQILPHHVYSIEGSLQEISETAGLIKSMLNFPLKAKENNNLSPAEFLARVNDLFVDAIGKTFREFLRERVIVAQEKMPFNVLAVIECIVLFHLIDEFGYYQDKKGKVTSRLWDSVHVYFASSCDVFITSDRNTCRKAQVVFAYYNLPVKTIHYTKE